MSLIANLRGIAAGLTDGTAMLARLQAAGLTTAKALSTYPAVALGAAAGLTGVSLAFAKGYQWCYDQDKQKQCAELRDWINEVTGHLNDALVKPAVQVDGKDYYPLENATMTTTDYREFLAKNGLPTRLRGESDVNFAARLIELAGGAPADRPADALPAATPEERAAITLGQRLHAIETMLNSPAATKPADNADAVVKEAHQQFQRDVQTFIQAEQARYKKAEGPGTHRETALSFIGSFSSLTSIGSIVAKLNGEVQQLVATLDRKDATFDRRLEEIKSAVRRELEQIRAVINAPGKATEIARKKEEGAVADLSRLLDDVIGTDDATYKTSLLGAATRGESVEDEHGPHVVGRNKRGEIHGFLGVQDILTGIDTNLRQFYVSTADVGDFVLDTNNADAQPAIEAGLTALNAAATELTDAKAAEKRALTAYAGLVTDAAEAVRAAAQDEIADHFAEDTHAAKALTEGADGQRAKVNAIIAQAVALRDEEKKDLTALQLTEKLEALRTKVAEFRTELAEGNALLGVLPVVAAVSTTAYTEAVAATAAKQLAMAPLGAIRDSAKVRATAAKDLAGRFEGLFTEKRGFTAALDAVVRAAGNVNAMTAETDHATVRDRFERLGTVVTEFKAFVADEHNGITGKPLESVNLGYGPAENRRKNIRSAIQEAGAVDFHLVFGSTVAVADVAKVHPDDLEADGQPKRGARNLSIGDHYRVDDKEARGLLSNICAETKRLAKSTQGLDPAGIANSAVAPLAKAEAAYGASFTASKTWSAWAPAAGVLVLAILAGGAHYGLPRLGYPNNFNGFFFKATQLGA